MKIVNDYVKIDTALPKILESYLDNMKIGVFDIETLGLNPEFSELILSGFLEIDETGSVKSTQYFAESVYEEDAVLLKTIEHLNSFDCVVTYNGKHFDIPFVSKRCQKLGISTFKKELYNFDIYLLVNGHSPFKKLLPDLKQKTVEEYFGIGSERFDEISGKDSIDFYHSYCECKEPGVKSDMERQILLHNHDDILQLFKLIPIVKKCDIHKAFFKLGFPVKGLENLTAGISWDNFTIDKISVTSKKISAYGRYPGLSFSYIGFEMWEHPYNIELKMDNTYEMSFPVDSAKGSMYVDLDALGLSCFDFERYPGYVNDYLIIKIGNDINYLEANMLLKSMLNRVMADIVR